MSNLSPEQYAMAEAEGKIRKALDERDPAARSQALMREYRLIHPSYKDAFVMGLIARVAVAPQEGG